MASAAETAKLLVSLELKDNFSKGVKSATTSLGKLDTSLGKIGGMAQQGLGTAARNLAKIGAVAAVGVGAMVKSGIESLATLESAVASVDGAIDQMNLTVTGSQVATWANEIEAAVGAAFDDKAIVAATENLIRYGKVTEENLRPAMEVMTDLAAKTGDVESASSLLGKALADPAKAAGKLSRYGIILTKTQQDQLKAMVEVNDVAGAQALLLDVLADTTKGAAAASQGPYKRAMSVLADVTEDAQRALAEGFLPVLMRLSDILGKALADPKVIANIREFGKGLATGLDSLISIAQNLPWAQIGQSLQLAGQGAKTVLGMFNSMPPWVQTAILTGWGLNKLTGGALGGIVGELGKGLIKGVLGMTAAVVNLKAGSVIGGVMGGGAGGAAGGVATGAAGRIASAVRIIGAVSIAGASLAALATVFGQERARVGDAAENLRDKARTGIPKLDQTATVNAIRAIDDQLSNPIVDLGLAILGGRDELRQTKRDLVYHLAELDRTSSDTTATIKNGFVMQESAIRNGFTVNLAKADAVKTATDAVKTTTAAGDARTAARIDSLNAATKSGLSGVVGAARGTTGAINSKNWSPRITVPVNVATTVSIRSVTAGQAYTARYNEGARIYEP